MARVSGEESIYLKAAVFLGNHGVDVNRNDILQDPILKRYADSTEALKAID